MSVEEEREFVTGIFRCVDPVENFRLRVILKPVKNIPIPLPHFDLDKTISSQDSTETEERPDTEDRIFYWQEKVFSRHEIKKYSNLSNCKTKTEEKYHDQVTELLKNKKEDDAAIFTYIDVDNYKMKLKDFNLVQGDESYVSCIARKINKLEISGGGLSDYRNIAKRNVVKERPSSEFCKRSHYVGRNVQKMFVMLDMRALGEESKKASDSDCDKEVVLCVITYDVTNKVLEVFPSFSTSETARPYSVGYFPGEARSRYHFLLLNNSRNISKEEEKQEKQLMDRFSQYQHEVRNLQTSSEFITHTPRGRLSCVIFGEICSAQNFEYDYLFVHFFVILPAGWSCPETDSLTGVTQAAKTNSRGVAHYSHLFHLTLFLDLSCRDGAISWPEMYFEVLSLDKWSRYRNEGYCWTSIPRTPGMALLNLRCWRPLDSSCKSKMRRFFIGGGPELDNIAYIGSFERQKGTVVSRFGFRTAPSGSLDIKLNILHESATGTAKQLSGEGGQQLQPSSQDHLDVSTLLGSLNAVLEAFRKARERMLRAKQSLELSDES